MHSYDYSQQSDDYTRIEKAIQYLEANFKSQPTLEKIAESVHLSKYHICCSELFEKLNNLLLYRRKM